MLLKCLLAPEKHYFFLTFDIKSLATDLKRDFAKIADVQPTVGRLTKLMRGCKTKVFYLLLVEHLFLQLLHHLALVVDLIIL